MIYQDKKLPEEILKYESADEIHIEQITDSVNDLFQQIFRRQKIFNFEKVFKEIII